MTRSDDADRPKPITSAALGLVSEALARLRFGSIHLTVHDGKVMQVDVTERKRIVT